MSLTEAEIINHTLAYIARNRLVAATCTADSGGTTGYQLLPIMAVLLAYEEDMRRLHEAAAEGALSAPAPPQLACQPFNHQPGCDCYSNPQERILASTAAALAPPALEQLRKAVARYDANDSETSYYDAKDVCDAARALLADVARRQTP